MSPLFYLGNVIIFFLCTAAFIISDDAGYRMSFFAPAVIIAGLVCYGAMALLFRRGFAARRKPPPVADIFTAAAAFRRRRMLHKRNFRDE